jgi:NADH-quinone oxidoreductase subunit M
MGFPVLDLIVFLPLGAAIAVALLPKSAPTSVLRALGLGAAVVEFAVVLWMVIDFKTGDAHAGFQFTSHQSWFSPIGVSWYLGVDGISLFLVAMTALLFPIAMASPPGERSSKAYLGWMLLLESACMTTFLSLDAFLFFVAFEVTLVPGYFLIVNGGGPRRGYAATKFFLYTFAGSAFLFVGILATYVLASAHEPSGTKASFDIIALARATVHLPIADQELLLLAFGVAFAVKMPLVPFHTWMPDAYTQAPTGGSMVLAGILFKLGAYGILRWGIFLFPQAAVNLAPLALTLAAVGIIWGSVVAAMQRDLKRLVAYGTVAGVGFIVIGLFGFTSEGITGGIVEMVNHGLSTGALFLLVGMVWERRRTYSFSQLGGLQTAAPILGWVFMAVIMSDIGLPGLHNSSLVGGGGDDRSGPGGGLPFVGVPARLPRPRPGHKPGREGHELGGESGGGPATGRHHFYRCLPPARLEPDRARRRSPRRPHRVRRPRLQDPLPGCRPRDFCRACRPGRGLAGSNSQGRRR